MANVTKTYRIDIAGLDTAGPLVGELREEFKQLSQQLAEVGADSSAGQKIQERLGVVRGEIKGLRDDIKSLDPEQRIAAFANFAQGVVGAFGVATTAAQAFGLSSATAKEYEEKLLGVVTVLGSLQSVQQALDGETLKSVKSTLALANAYVFSGAAATGAGKAARIALIGTGIGILLIAVAALIQNFDKIKAVAGEIYQRFKPQFDAIGGLISATIAGLRNLGSALTFGLIDDAKTAATAAAKEISDTLRVARINDRTRQIAEQKAAGAETFALQEQQLNDQLNQLKEAGKKETEEYKNKLSELTQLRNTEDKRLADEFEKQRSNEEQKEKAANDKRAEERKREAEAHRQALDDKFLEQFESDQRIEDQRIESAERALDFEIKKAEKANKAAEQAEVDRLALIQRARVSGAAVAEKIDAEIAERARIKALPPLSLSDTLLIRVFGLTPEQLDVTKQKLAEAAQALSGLLTQIYTNSTAEADARIQETQDRLATINDELAAAQKASADNVAALDNAKGAKREFLIAQIQRERTEESRLAAEKARAAKEAEKAQKERARLDKEQQKITAVLTAATSAAAAAEAINAGIKAVSGANTLPFPANLAAIVAALAATTGAVLAAKNLGKTFENGGLVTGPSHAQGGINMFHRNGAYLGNMQGNEFVVNAEASLKNRALLEMINSAGRTRVLAPSGYFANGGPVPSGDNSSNQGSMISVPVANLDALLESNRVIAATLADIRNFGPARFNIGPGEALGIREQEQIAVQTKADATL